MASAPDLLSADLAFCLVGVRLLAVRIAYRVKAVGALDPTAFFYFPARLGAVGGDSLAAFFVALRKRRLRQSGEGQDEQPAFRR